MALILDDLDTDMSYMAAYLLLRIDWPQSGESLLPMRIKVRNTTYVVSEEEEKPWCTDVALRAQEETLPDITICTNMSWVLGLT